MGVSGSGKTTIAQRVADGLNWEFLDADDVHPAANIDKMQRGQPLDDSDRAPWLATLADILSKRVTQQRPIVLACSALKQSYRDRLQQGCRHVSVVYLKGSYDTIYNRMQQRSQHFMKADLLASQFAILEEPEEALVLALDQPLDAIVQAIHTHIVNLTPVSPDGQTD
ncbi:MAG: gluconokinase [Leptolyngbya sp. DLM2.Bin15]|nr:MAG: gluconokinase [Leptolyngbya sp. DLM2.Bin15]